MFFFRIIWFQNKKDFILLYLNDVSSKADKKKLETVNKFKKIFKKTNRNTFLIKIEIDSNKRENAKPGRN